MKVFPCGEGGEDSTCPRESVLPDEVRKSSSKPKASGIVIRVLNGECIIVTLSWRFGQLDREGRRFLLFFGALKSHVIWSGPARAFGRPILARSFSRWNGSVDHRNGPRESASYSD